MCYNAVKDKWLVWSAGYNVLLENTTLRGVRVHAPIAGKALMQPPKQYDAIWPFFYKIRGQKSEPTFKAEQLELAVVIDEEDVIQAEHLKEGAIDPDFDDTSDIIAKVSERNYILFVWIIYHLPLGQSEHAWPWFEKT